MRETRELLYVCVVWCVQWHDLLTLISRVLVLNDIANVHVKGSKGVRTRAVNQFKVIAFHYHVRVGRWCGEIGVHGHSRSL